MQIALDRSVRADLGHAEGAQVDRAERAVRFGESDFSAVRGHDEIRSAARAQQLAVCARGGIDQVVGASAFVRYGDDQAAVAGPLSRFRAFKQLQRLDADAAAVEQRIASAESLHIRGSVDVVRLLPRLHHLTESRSVFIQRLGTGFDQNGMLAKRNADSRTFRHDFHFGAERLGCVRYRDELLPVQNERADFGGLAVDGPLKLSRAWLRCGSLNGSCGCCAEHSGKYDCG
ncbi:hypothetical protein BN871_AC_00910 [Paenibacillus sp. P22]|nr:hypothetical protein BN871_AC_00910 [Paenibacillus sp. P22]